MGYTQYWTHGTYRLDNGAFDDIEKILKVSLDDAAKIVGEEAVDEIKKEVNSRWAWRLGDVFDFGCLTRHYIYTNAFGETAMFFDSAAAMWAWHYLYDREFDDYSYREFCKPYHNLLSDATLCAILIAISMHSPNACIKSDGYWCEPNWQAGAELYKLACGVEAECPENVALECHEYSKNTPNGEYAAYLHIYRNKASTYAPYEKALNHEYDSADSARATLAEHGYELSSTSREV